MDWYDSESDISSDDSQKSKRIVSRSEISCEKVWMCLTWYFHHAHWTPHHGTQTGPQSWQSSVGSDSPRRSVENREYVISPNSVWLLGCFSRFFYLLQRHIIGEVVIFTGWVDIVGAYLQNRAEAQWPHLKPKDGRYGFLSLIPRFLFPEPFYMPWSFLVWLYIPCHWVASLLAATWGGSLLSTKTEPKLPLKTVKSYQSIIRSTISDIGYDLKAIDCHSKLWQFA